MAAGRRRGPRRNDLSSVSPPRRRGSMNTSLCKLGEADVHGFPPKFILSFAEGGNDTEGVGRDTMPHPRVTPEMIRLYDRFTPETLDRRELMAGLTRLAGSRAAKRRVGQE